MTFLCFLAEVEGTPPSPYQPLFHWTVSSFHMYLTSEHENVASTHLEVTALPTIFLVFFSLGRNVDRGKKGIKL